MKRHDVNRWSDPKLPFLQRWTVSGRLLLAHRSKGGRNVPVCVCDIDDKPKRTWDISQRGVPPGFGSEKGSPRSICYATYLVSLQHVRVTARALRARSRGRGRVLLGRWYLGHGEHSGQKNKRVSGYRRWGFRWCRGAR
jgi:hypothetical protein